MFEVLEDAPPPNIDVPKILDKMKKLPSKLYKLQGKGPGRSYAGSDHRSSKKSSGAYEMTQFREMVILSLAEMHRDRLAREEAAQE